MTLAVCSWSLQPSSPSDLVAKVSACGLSAVQLALDPIRTGAWEERETVETLRDAGIDVVSGMMAFEAEDYSTLETIRATGGVRLDEKWEEHQRIARADAALAARLGLKLVTFHAGFLPHEPGDPVRTTMIGRLIAVVGSYAEHGIVVGLETGQETGETLIGVLDELDLGDAVGVNFDPANMVLYGMGDPTEALRALMPRVVQLHVKDAAASGTPGNWGTEVPVGDGQVDWDAFFSTVVDSGRELDFCIEREAGESRVEDIRRAADVAWDRLSV